jgi:plasmid maintenance system antidote protein VapI
METEKQTEFAKLHIRLRQATDSLHAQAEEVHDMARKLEDLTKDTTIRYSGLRVKVEARAAFDQAKDLREAIEEMGKQMRARRKGPDLLR